AEVRVAGGARGAWSAMSVGAALLVSAPAHAAMLACTGVFAFADAQARAVTLVVDRESGKLRTPSCFKYPELAGFCTGQIRHARNHQFVFGAIASAENSKISAELWRPSAAGVDVLEVLFVGRCAPRHPSRHSR